MLILLLSTDDRAYILRETHRLHDLWIGNPDCSSLEDAIHYLDKRYFDTREYYEEYSGEKWL